MAETIGGIRQDSTAFRHLLITPEPVGRLTQARATYDGVRGLIETDWQLVNGILELSVRIPANTTATIILPTSSMADVTADGVTLEKSANINMLKQESNRLHLSVGSGQYRVRIHHPIIARETLGRCRLDHASIL